jgi:alkylation response protein AidB-like acyl-CoA dehydrogenase
MSTLADTAPADVLAFGVALERIAARAMTLDRAPRFPAENFSDLRAAGALSRAVGRAAFARDVSLVRGVACVDASTARILDGHLNGAERVAMLGEALLAPDELARIEQGELLVGVWGADPGPGEGEPATLLEAGDTLVLRGVKTFCSGAGGVDRALVVVRDADDVRRVAYVDTACELSIDRDWYRASGLRSSESHRVEFHETPVLAVLGGPGELTREPWFSRDAVRSTATWAGLADCILDSTIAALASVELDETRVHAIGEMRVARATIDRWLEYAVSALWDADPDRPGRWRLDAPAGPNELAQSPSDLAAECRIAIAGCARLIAAQAARVSGSRALAGGGTLERGRRDLDLFLLQHRLDPKLTSLGAGLLADRRA